MGQSVLTPEEDLLGKVGELLFRFRVLQKSYSLGIGGKGIRTKIPKPACGECSGFLARHEAVKQLTTAGRQGSLAWGELSFLFDVAEALNVISGGERLLNTQGKQRAFLALF